MGGGAWWAAIRGVAKSWTQLSDFTFTFHFHALEKEMATHSSVFAWRILGTGEPDGLPSMGSHRAGHDWSDLAATAAWETMGLGLCSHFHHSALPEMPTVCTGGAPLRFISSTPWTPCPVLIGLLLGVNKTEYGTREHWSKASINLSNDLLM